MPTTEYNLLKKGVRPLLSLLLQAKALWGLTPYLFILVASLAQAAEYGVVTANFVKVRQGPGADYPGISQLNRGHVVTRLRTQGEWTEVSFINAKLPKGKQQRTGWMSSRYIKVDPVSNRPKRNKKNNAAELTELVQPTPIGKGTPHLVKIKSLKVRSGPSTKHIRLSAIPFQHPVMVFNKDNGWARITTIDPNNDGKVLNGWVAAHFLKKDWATINATFNANNNTKTKTRGQSPKGYDPKQPAKTIVKSIAKTEAAAPKPQPKPEPKPQPKPQPKPEPKPQPKPQPKPEPKPTPNFSTNTEKPNIEPSSAPSPEPQQTSPQSFKDRLKFGKPQGQSPKGSDPKANLKTQPVMLTLEKEQLACQRTDEKEVKGCELTMRFSLQGEPEITRAKIRCEADLLVGMAEGDPVRYPLNQEQIYRVKNTPSSYEMITTLEASGGTYNIRTVDLLSHRCAVTAFGRSKK